MKDEELFLWGVFRVYRKDKSALAEYQILQFSIPVNTDISTFPSNDAINELRWELSSMYKDSKTVEKVVPITYFCSEREALKYIEKNTH